MKAAAAAATTRQAPLSIAIQVGEKASPELTLWKSPTRAATARGPCRDNAIYQLAQALTKIERTSFPVHAQRHYTRASSPDGAAGGGAAWQGHDGPCQEPGGCRRGRKRSSTQRDLQCHPAHDLRRHVAEAGHATTPCPSAPTPTSTAASSPAPAWKRCGQAAGGGGRSQDQGHHRRHPQRSAQGAPAVDRRIVKPVEQMAAKMWPGVPVVPFMSAGATDGAFLTPAGIPTYGISGTFGDPDGNGAHGLNQRIRTKVVYDSRDYLIG